MAENSKREQIILADVEIMKTLSFIKHTERTIQTYSDLQNFSETQLPVAAIVGRLPVPKDHRTGRSGQVDMIISELRVDIFVYMQSAKEQDALISNMLDDIWPALYANPMRGKLCLVTQLIPSSNVEYWDPYVAFRISCVHQYQHDTQGI